MQDLIEELIVAVAGTPLAPIVAELSGREGLPTFTPPGPWRADLSRTLVGLSPWQTLPDLDAESAKAVVSGLLLRNDDLDRSHDLSQDLPSRTGS